MRDVQGALVLRKDREAIWGKLVGLTSAILVWGVAIAQLSLKAALLSSLALWAVVAVMLVERARLSRIILTEHELIVKGLLVRRRRSRADAARVVRATIVAPQAPETEWLFVLDAHGKVLFRVEGDSYTTGDFDRLVNGLGLPCGGPDKAVKWSELNRMYPGLVPRSGRHGTLIATLFVSAFILLFVAAIIFLSVKGYLPDRP